MESSLSRDVQMQFMRPGQLEAAIRKFPVVYVPFGLIEWHGRHLPLGNDAIKAHAILVKCAEQFGGVVYPPQWLHNGFNQEHLVPVYSDLFQRFKRTGFRVIIGVSGHNVKEQIEMISKALEPVVADGGELIIYAPHISDVSVTHGELIESIGYHVRDYFVKQPDRFADIPGGVMAHSTHVRGIGTYENGVEKPRINVTLTTNIPEEICKKINMGYRDPETIDVNDFVNREDDGILYVKKAGEMLYRLKNDPF